MNARKQVGIKNKNKAMKRKGEKKKRNWTLATYNQRMRLLS